MASKNPNQLELTPQPRVPSDEDRYADLGIMNYHSARLRSLGGQATAAASPAPAASASRPQPAPRRGRNRDGSIDRRTLSYGGRRAADRPTPNYFPYNQ